MYHFNPPKVIEAGMVSCDFPIIYVELDFSVVGHPGKSNGASIKILRDDLGLSTEEISRLRQQGVVS